MMGWLKGVLRRTADVATSDIFVTIVFRGWLLSQPDWEQRLDEELAAVKRDVIKRKRRMGAGS